MITQLRAQGLARSEGDGDAVVVLPFSEPIQQAALGPLKRKALGESEADMARAAAALTSREKPHARAA